MRTTLTIRPEIAAQLKALVKHQNKSLKDIVNDVLAYGLSYKKSPSSQPKEFKVTPFKLNLRSGIDEKKLNSLVDQLDTEKFHKTSK